MTLSRDVPDSINWHDTGCEVSPSCLSCPLPVCKYEMANGIKSARALLRHPEVLSMTELGMNISQIARELGVSRRSVRRSLHAARS